MVAGLFGFPYDVSLAVGRTRLEAVAAIHRLVAARLERNFRHTAALAAGRAEHLALAAAAEAAAASAALTATARRFTRGAAIRTTVRLVGKALHGEELLLAGRKRELTRTIDTVQIFILVHALNEDSSIT